MQNLEIENIVQTDASRPGRIWRRMQAQVRHATRSITNGMAPIINVVLYTLKRERKSNSDELLKLLPLMNMEILIAYIYGSL